MTRRLHAEARRDLADRLALIGAFGVGIAGVVAIKQLGAPTWFAILFPVAVLLAYVGVCLLAGRLRIEPEAVGDNCYYLGFLFTLGSLATALYQLGAAGGGPSADKMVPLVVGGFGVALSSTIAGVFLRIVLLQMRPDLVAQDRETRRDMQAAMREMRADISTASREFKAMAIEAAQRAAERSAEVDAITERALATSGAVAERQAAALADRLDGLLRDSLGRRLDEAADGATAFDAERARLRDATDALTEAVARLDAGASQAGEALAALAQAAETPRPILVAAKDRAG